MTALFFMIFVQKQLEYLKSNKMLSDIKSSSTIFIKTRKNCCPLLTTVVSGSPIIQNGKIIGAVTHVLVNDPTRGYGIFIENMLKEAE